MGAGCTSTSSFNIRDVDEFTFRMEQGQLTASQGAYSFSGRCKVYRALAVIECSLFTYLVEGPVV